MSHKSSDWSKQVIEKAIRKALRNGWGANTKAKTSVLATAEIIYDKGFAKALWGEAPSRRINSYLIEQDGLGWEDHLKRMVVADDPIAYLEENI